MKKTCNTKTNMLRSAMKGWGKSACTAAVALCLLLASADALAQAGSGVYVGGHIRRARPSTITKLRESGFTYVILFNVNVEENGDLTVDNGGEAGGVICSNGQYIFNRVQPNYVADVKALKTEPTSIDRIEICIGGWGNQSYNRIKDLVNTEGTGENSILYRNFKALKEAIPEIDAVNNDDEHAYHATTAVAFHKMMYELGYKTTVAPYTNKSFWTSLVTQLNRQYPDACDRVLIQCYDGGAGNNPSDWKLGNLPVHAGRTNYQTDMQTSINQMQSWKNNNGVVGGFVWVYNDETWDLHQWATAMNRVFRPYVVSDEDACATVYSETNFGGYAINLPEGAFPLADLAAYGVTKNDIESLKVKEGYQIQLFTATSPQGASASNPVFTEESADLSYLRAGRDANFRNRTSSILISKIEETGIALPQDHSTNQNQLFNIQGQPISQPVDGEVYILNGKKYKKQ